MCENSAQYHLLSCNLFKYIAESEDLDRKEIKKVNPKGYQP